MNKSFPVFVAISITFWIGTPAQDARVLAPCPTDAPTSGLSAVENEF